MPETNMSFAGSMRPYDGNDRSQLGAQRRNTQVLVPIFSFPTSTIWILDLLDVPYASKSLEMASISLTVDPTRSHERLSDRNTTSWEDSQNQ